MVEIPALRQEHISCCPNRSGKFLMPVDPDRKWAEAPTADVQTRYSSYFRGKKNLTLGTVRT